MLAGIVWAAFHVFKDILYEMGIHKLEAASLGPTQQLRAAGNEDRVDTVIQIPFWYQQTWSVEQRPNLFLERFCFFESLDERSRYVRARMELAYASRMPYVLSRMDVSNPFAYRYVSASQNLIDPDSISRYVNGLMTIQDPVHRTRYVRAQMRVA